MYNLYSYRKKRPAGLIITLLLITAIIGGTGYLVYKKLKAPIIRKNDTAIQAEEQSDTVAKKDELRLDKNAEFDLTLYYKCGHKVHSKKPIPDDFFNKTSYEIMEEFPQYDLYSFSRNKIAANQITDEYCDNHFIIILKGNKLISYNRSTPDVIIKEGVINTVDFLPEDIEILKNGIEVTSQNELLEYFESLSS